MGMCSASSSTPGPTAVTATSPPSIRPEATRITAADSTPSRRLIRSAYAGEKGCWVALDTTSPAVSDPSMARAVLTFADCPKTDMSATSASPTMSALAVAAVRRGFRNEFCVARSPTVPNTRWNTRPRKRRTGRPRTVDARETPIRITSIPRPVRAKPCPATPVRPTAISTTPAPTIEAPVHIRRRRDDSGTDASSRIASTGETDPARRAGRYAAATVTVTPTT